VNVSGFSSRCRTFISICNQPPRSTQSGHPSLGRRNEDQPKGGDSLRLGVKESMVYVWLAGAASVKNMGAMPKNDDLF